MNNQDTKRTEIYIRGLPIMVYQFPDGSLGYSLNGTCYDSESIGLAILEEYAQYPHESYVDNLKYLLNTLVNRQATKALQETPE